MPTLISIFILVIATFFAGCAVGPNYQKPNVPVEKNFAELGKNNNTNPPPVDWWKKFNDPELGKLVTEAAKQNYNLQIAMMRVREARYQRNIMAGNLLPTIDADAGYLKAYGSKNVKLPFGSGGDDPPDPPGPGCQ